MIDWYNSPDPQYPRFSVKYACFECRKAFSRRASKMHGIRAVFYFPLTGTCPQCGGALYYMGKDFQPPAQNKEKMWRELETDAKRYYARRLSRLRANVELFDPYFSKIKA